VLISNIFMLCIVHAMRLIVPLVVLPVLARRLTGEQYGLYMFVTSLSVWFGLFVEYGFAISGTRDVSSATTSRAVRESVEGIQSAKMLLAIALIPFSIIAAMVLPPLHGHEGWAAVAWALAVLTGLSPVYYFQGKEELKLAGLTELSAGIGFLGASLLLIRSAEDFASLPVLLILTRFVVTGTLSYRMGKTVGFSAVLRPAWQRGCAALKGGFDFFLFQAAVSLYTSFNVVYLGFFCSPLQIGAYASAERLIRAGTGFIGQTSVAIFPRLNSLRTKKSANLDAVRVRALLAIAMLGFVGMAFSWGIAPWIAEFFPAGNVHEVASLLRAMSFLIPAIAMSNVLGFQFLVVDRHEKTFNRIILAAAVVNLLLASTFVIGYGPYGVAFSWVVTEWLIALMCAALVLHYRSNSQTNFAG
jgi:PST family polysaccharide transporter